MTEKETGYKKHTFQKKEEGELSREEIEKVLKEAEDFIESRRFLFQGFAKDISLDIDLNSEGGFYIDLKEGVINFDLSWYAEKDFNPTQIGWAVLHEISHFLDLKEDPEAMIENFDYIESKGEDSRAYKIFYNCLDDIFVNQKVARKASNFDPSSEGGEEVEEAYSEILFENRDLRTTTVKDKNGNEVERPTPRHLQFVYKLLRDFMVAREEEEAIVDEEVQEALDTNINILGTEYTIEKLIDEYVRPTGTNLTEEKNDPGTRYKRLKKNLEPIFEELLEKDKQDRDYKPKKKKSGKGEPNGESKPEGEPDPDQETGDTDQEEEQEESSSEEEKGEEKGEGGAEKEEEGGDASSQKDKEETEEKKEGTSAEGEESEKEDGEDEKEEENGSESGGDVDQKEEGEEANFEDFYREFESKNPDQFSQDEIEDWLEKERQQRKEEEEKKKEKYPEEKLKEKQDKVDQEFADAHEDVSLKDVKYYRKLKSKVKEHLEELTKLWKSIVYGRSEQRTVTKKGYYKTGEDLDILQTIREWPDIDSGEMENVRVYKRTEEEREVVEQPELIRVRIVADMSGSMSSSDNKEIEYRYPDQKEGEEVKVEQQIPEKVLILAETLTLLLSSLQEFQMYLDSTRDKTGSELDVETEVWGFGGDAELLKPKSSEVGAGSEQASIIRAIKGLKKSKGGTNDHKPLQQINEEIEQDPELQKKIEEEKVMEIVLEITDGGSSDKEAAHTVREQLSEHGVIDRAIQIGATSENEDQKFNYVWGEKGIQIGEFIERLPTAVKELLKTYLKDVEI